MPTAQLHDRGIVAVTGPEAEHFLQNLVTTDLGGVEPEVARPGALLTPQGKILFDFLVSRIDGGFRLDCRGETVGDLARRLTLYKLRAKVEIGQQDQAVVTVGWDIDSGPSQSDSASSDAEGGWIADGRFADVAVWRRYDAVSPGDAAGEDAWHALRVAHGIAESGTDYALGDAFPHDVLLDETGGVGFRKGCFVGQEVVSRMQHRGAARRRVMLVETEAEALPDPGTDVSAGGRSIGSLGTVAGRRGLAIVRIDRVRDALDAGTPILAGEVAVQPRVPPWARYRLPEPQTGTDD